MTPSHSPSRQRVWDLLADEATQGLDASQKLELQRLLAEHPDIDPDALQLAAAASDLALFSGRWSASEALPASLHPRVTFDWQQHTALAAASPPQALPLRSSRAPVNRSWASHTGWLAAAACLGVAVLGWWPRFGQSGPSGQYTQFPAQASRGAVLAGAPIVSNNVLAAFSSDTADVKSADWQRASDKTGQQSGGTLYWSPSKQEGYMVFRDLAPNDPGVEQYQLWIFDSTRDEKFPVHGGVFDVPKGQKEVIVRIAPRLAITEATTFVITVERPGGVWVSDRSRIPLLAKLK